MTVLGGSLHGEGARRRVVRDLVEGVRHAFEASRCRVCRVYWLGWKTVGFRLPGRRLVVVHFYTRGWKLTPSRLASVVEAAEELRERVDPRAVRRVIVVAGSPRVATAGARRLARVLGVLLVFSARQAKGAVIASAATARVIASRVWGLARRVIDEASSWVALACARLGFPVETLAPTGPPPRPPRA